MWTWLWRSLTGQKAGLMGSVAGIACAFLLTIAFDAVWRGESLQIVAYARKMQADVWVMQRGVANMHMATSFIWDWKADRVAEVPGVERVTPILYLNTVIEVGDLSSFNYVVGLVPGDARAGPWDLTAGRTVERRGEAVLPDVLARLAGLGIGDTIGIASERFEVVGLSRGTYSSGNPVTFVRMDDLEDVLSSAGSYSYLLVDAEDGVDPRQLADAIMARVDKVNAMAADDFIESDYGMAAQMGVEIIFMMMLICFWLAAFIVGVTAYTVVVRRQRELAIVKALGVSNRGVVAAVVMQATLVTAAGFVVAAGVSVTMLPWAPRLVPQLSIAVSGAAIARMGIAALLVAIVGALLPARRVAKLDPAMAFHV